MVPTEGATGVAVKADFLVAAFSARMIARGILDNADFEFTK